MLRTFPLAYSWATSSNTKPVYNSVDYLMQFIEYCTESERQNGCKRTVWSCSCSIAQHHEGSLSIILLAQEKTKIQRHITVTPP